MPDESNFQYLDRELIGLLKLWIVPARPASMDRRITKSFLSLKNHKLRFASPHLRPTLKEVSMNRCIACDDYAATAHYEFRVTMISSTGLASRLLAEVSFLVAQCRLAWPEFKRDPIG